MLRPKVLISSQLTILSELGHQEKWTTPNYFYLGFPFSSSLRHLRPTIRTISCPRWSQKSVSSDSVSWMQINLRLYACETANATTTTPKRISARWVILVLSMRLVFQCKFQGWSSSVQFPHFILFPFLTHRQMQIISRPKRRDRCYDFFEAAFGKCTANCKNG